VKGNCTVSSARRHNAESIATSERDCRWVQ
jgi:hypothetical protein